MSGQTTTLLVGQGGTTLLVDAGGTTIEVNNGPIVLEGVQGIPGPAQADVLTAVGDLLGYNGAPARLAVGADDQILIADSTQAIGFRWDAQTASSPLTDKGDLYTFDTVDQRLPVGVDGQFLRANSVPATGLEWAAFTASDIPAHATTHEDGGPDEINVAGLSGLLAEPQTPVAHASSHENGGPDEIDVSGLSGLLADAQTPLGHGATHLPLGSDALATVTAVTIDADTPNAVGVANAFSRADHTHSLPTSVPVDVGVANAAGASASLSRADHVHALPALSLPAHANTHEDGGSDEVNVDGLSGLLADAQAPTDHSSTHLPSGSDPLTTAIAVEITDSTNVEGAAESFARSDHGHAHGARAGGTQHALVTSVVAGFMLGADKAKLDLYPATPAEPLTVLYFRPGGAAGPGVALTWAEVDAFATATQVPWRLVCDSSIVQCEVPSAFDTDFRGLGSITFIIQPTDTHLLIRDGGVIRNIDELQFGSLRCESLTAPGVIADIPGRAMLLLRGGIVSNQVTSLVAAFEMTTRGVLLAQLGGAIENFAAVPVVSLPDTTAPYIMIQMSSIGGTTWADNTFSSPAGVVIVAVHDSTARFGNHAAVAGFVLDLPSANPQNIGWNSGNTASRPVAFSIGQPYFDTTLGHQIWWNGAAWVNAAGAVV